MKSFLSKILCRPCTFCAIADGNTSDKILYKDNDIVAFYDIAPAAETHILIIPKDHIDSVKTIRVSNYDLLLKMQSKAHDLLRKHGHDPASSRLGFHIPPYNTVDHLHLHVLRGKFKPSKSVKYEIGKKWYKDLLHLLSELEQERSKQNTKPVLP